MRVPQPGWLRLCWSCSARYILQQPVHQLYNEFIVPRWGVAQAVGFYGYAALLVLVSIGVFLTFERPLQRGLRGLAPRHA